MGAIIGICVTAFILRLFAMPSKIPAGALSFEALQAQEWWSVFTHIFIHANIMHLGSNLLLLFIAGRAVERHVGSRHFTFIFLVSAWAGAALNMCFRPEPLVGASGGVMGIVGAFTALFPEYDVMRPVRRFVPLRLKAKFIFPAMVASFSILALITHLLGDRVGPSLYAEAHLAHLGGVLAGWAYGARLAAEGQVREEWHDFFPQGLRRQSRESRPDGLPVAAGFLPEQIHGERESLAPPPIRELSDTEFLDERVDPVLEKLYANGADKLTSEERAILEEASRRFSRAKR